MVVIHGGDGVMAVLVTLAVLEQGYRRNALDSVSIDLGQHFQMHFQRGFNVSKALPQFYVVVKDCKIVILTLYKRLAGIFKFILVSVLAGTETFSVGESYGRGFRLFWRRFQKAT